MRSADTRERPALWRITVATILITTAVALCVLTALFWSRGVWNAAVLGYALGVMVMGGLVSYLIAGRKKVRNVLRFSLIFFSISLVLILLEMANHHGSPDVEAADKLARHLSGNFWDLAKAHRQKVAELQPDLQMLYSAQSYSSPVSIKRTRDAVKNVAALDHEFITHFETFPARVQQEVAQSSLSDTAKQLYLQGYLQGVNSNAYSSALEVGRKRDQIERQWCNETVALYDFALAHQKQIQIKDDHLIITDERTRGQFNNLLKQAKEQRQRLQDAKAEMEKLQKEFTQTLGLTREGLGPGGRDSSPPI